MSRLPRRRGPHSIESTPTPSTIPLPTRQFRCPPRTLSTPVVGQMGGGTTFSTVAYGHRWSTDRGVGAGRGFRLLVGSSGPLVVGCLSCRSSGGTVLDGRPICNKTKKEKREVCSGRVVTGVVGFVPESHDNCVSVSATVRSGLYFEPRRVLPPVKQSPSCGHLVL